MRVMVSDLSSTAASWSLVGTVSKILAAEVAGLDNQKEIDDHIQEALRRHFRPEFLNRIDEIVVFHRLGLKELKQVVDIQVAILAERLKAKGRIPCSC